MLIHVAARPTAEDVLRRARTRVDATNSRVDAAAIIAAKDADKR